MPARDTAPASSTSTAATTPVSAKSPLRRATSSTAKPVRPDHTGKCTAREDLVLADGRGPRADEELGRRDRAGAARAGDLELGVERERDRRQLRRGVGVGDRATDRAPVADLEVTDERDGLGEQRHRLTGGGVVLDRALAWSSP